ncbi:MAG: parallel beta-helix repeat protein [Bacteroidia bacterium]|jgi:parallel beta-helix repeat protein
MKKLYSLLLAFGVIAMLSPISASAQSYTYTPTKSSADAGNPGNVRTLYDYSSSGATMFMTGYTGPNGSSSSSYQSTNYWSAAQPIPFTFKFHGNTVDSFSVSKNGLLTFTKSVAGTAVNTALNTNSSLPNSNLPDSTVAWFWDNMGTTVGQYDRMYRVVHGSTGSRQLWVFYTSWEFGHTSNAYAYNAVVLEEGSNKIFVVDMSYNYGTYSSTIGVQLNSSNAVQFSSGIHSSAGSPSIILGSYQGSAPANNEYYEMKPKLLVTDDIAITSMTNPAGAICTTSDSVKVLVKNEGTNSVSSFDIVWSINGTSQTKYSHSGTLASGTSTTVNLGKYTYGTSVSTFNFVFRSDKPNGNTDKNLKNDTLKHSLNKGLDGDYSVGTSSSDFATVSAAMTALKAAGVCGPVVMNIASGTYTGQIALEGDIPGASATNTVTFRSATGVPANVTLAYTSTSSATRTTLLLKKTSFIIIRDITIESKGTTYGWAGHVWSANNIQFRNCHFKSKYVGTSSNSINLCLSGSATSWSTGVISNDVTVDSCTFTNAGYSFSAFGPSTSSFSNNLVFTNNTMNNCYRGLMLYYQGAPQINNNQISLLSAGNGYSGIYMYYNKSTSTVPIRIIGNTILNSDVYGIYLSNCDNPSTQKGEMYNNMIGKFVGSPTFYGIYNNSSDYWKLYHNTVDIRTSSSSSVYGCYFSSVNYSDMRNNIFSVQSSSSSSNHYAMYNRSSPSSTRTCDYNVYYNPNGTYLIYFAGGKTASVLNTYSTLADVNSLNIMPSFTSASDLHLSDACFNKVPSLTAVNEDIDGDSRNPSTTHPGADEIGQSSNDVGVVTVMSPAGTVSSGTQTVKVIVRNYGGNTVTGYNVSYKVDGGSTVTQAVTNSLSTCTNDTITFTTTFSHTVGCTNLTAWTSAPNSSTDGNGSNDTTSSSFGVAMSGTFTVGSSSSDYTTIDAAIEALNCAGVSGAVVFNIASGTYTGQFEVGGVTGASATNTITFQAASGTASDVKITTATTSSSDRHTIRLNNAKYIVLRNLTIEGTNTTYAWPLIIMKSDYITVKGCAIKTTTENTSTNYIGIVISGSATSYSSSYKATDIVIDSCSITKVSFGLMCYGGGSSTSTLSPGLKIMNSTFSNIGSYGMWIYYQTGTVIHNNVINLGTANEGYTGIYCYYVKNNCQITQNQIRNSGYQGIYLGYCDNTSSTKSVFANNTIGSFRGSPTFYGVYNSSSDYWDVHHNTIVVDIATSSTARAFYMQSVNYYNVRNNIFVINGNSTTSNHLPFYTSTSANGSTRVLDYNVYYNKTGSYALYNGGYRTPAALNTYSSVADDNSASVKVPLKSTADLHLADGCFMKFPSISTVTTDMDGATRNTTTTHPGADEVETGAVDVGVSEILSPIGVVTAGSQTVKVVVKNYGSTTINTVVVDYQIGSATSQSETFTVSMAACTADTLTFTTAASHTAGCKQVRAWTSSPNGTTDAVTGNDEGPPVTIGVPMAGGVFTVGTSSSDFETIQDAIDEMQCAGIGGAVVFKIASGTYVGQWELENIPGTSSTNTITLQSATGDPKDVMLLNSAGSYGNAHTLLVKGVNHVRLRGMTIEGAGGYAWPLHIWTSKHVKVDRCVFDANGLNSTSSGKICVVVNTSATSYSYGGLGHSDSLTVDSCIMQEAGWTGFMMAGVSSSISNKTPGLIFSNNMVTANYRGIWLQYVGGSVLHNNVVSMNTSALSYTGLYLYYCGASNYKGQVITNNQIYNCANQNVVMTQCDNTSTNRGLFANNVVTKTRGSNQLIGIYNNGGDYWDFFHNTIDVDKTSYTGTVYGLYTSGSNTNVRNNSFSITSTTVATSSYCMYHPSTPNSSTYRVNNNNYYFPRGASGGLYYAGGVRTSSNFNTYSTTADFNSINVNPSPSSSRLYHMNQEHLFGAGDSTGTLKDVEGATRPVKTPTIGALEINPDLNVMSVAGDSACGTNNSSAAVKVTFKNEGDIIQQGAHFNVTLDAGTPVLVSITGPFAKGVTYTRTLPITLDLSGTAANVITVTNADGDVDASDNSASTSVPYWANPVSSFTYKDSCLGDAMSFTNTSTVATGSITSTGWMFGDGNTASTTNPTNTYASSGNYTVTIMSESNVGCRDTVKQTVSVLTALAAGTITGAKTVCYNTSSGSINSTASASGSAGAYEYQWQSSTDNVTFADITAATSADYTSGALTQTTYFRRAVTTDIGCGPSQTGSIKITVYDMLVGGVIGSDQNICYNTTPSSMTQSAAPTGGDGTWTYQWESSANGTSWSSVTGATASSYAPGALTATTYYRSLATGGSSCGTIASNVVKILVYNDLYAGLVGTNHSVCPQSPANTLNGTNNPSGGDNSYTYQWQTSPDNTTWSDITGATSASLTSTTALTATTFYRRNTTSGSGCGTKPTNAVTVTIAPLPKSSFIVANHCFNDVMPVTNNSTVTTGSLTGFAWDFGDGNTSASRVPSHVYSASGFKTVKLKVTSNIGCVDSSTNKVNVSNVPTPAFTKVFDCVKEEVLFKNATSVNCGKISAFAWDFGDGSTSTVANPKHKYSSTGTYAVKFKIFLPGGFRDSVTRNVVIAKKGVSGFTADDECFGDSVRFINASTNAASYDWDFDDKTSSTLENPVHFYRVAQTYSVTLVTTDGNACDDTTTKNVTIKVKPSVYFSTDDRCVNTDEPFKNGTLYAHTYSWTFGDGGTSNSTAKALTYRYNTATNYIVKLVAYNNNGCRDSFSKKVVVFPNPTASFTLANTCTGDAVNATNTSTSNHGNHWDMGDGATFTTTTPKHQYNKAGTFAVTLTVESINGCKDTTQSNVTVYDTPDADFSASKVCAGSATSFTNKSTGGSGTVTHAWNFGDGNTSSSASPNHTYAAAGKYTVSLSTTGQGSCVGTVSKTVEVYEVPTASISVSDVCVGKVSTFSASTTGASTYAWSFGDGNTNGSVAPSHTYAKAGTYTVSVTVTSVYGCAVTSTTTTMVNDLPTTGFTNSTVCLGDATVFTNTTSISSGTLSYSWDFGDGSSSSAASPSHSYGSAGTYTVVLTATANGCSASYSAKVVVNDEPTADFTNNTVCLGSVTSFTNYSGGATKYSWNFGDGSTASTATTPTHTYASAGTFTVTLTAENASGCSDVKTVSVTVLGLPTADFSLANACAGSAVSFTNNSSTGSYIWSFGDGGASSTKSPTHTYKTAGNYTVSIEVTNANGCESTVSKQITIYDLPKADFAATSGCEKAGIQFTNMTTGTNTYAWTFGDAGTSAAKDPNHTYASANTYSVSLTATNSSNCSSTATKTVVVSAQPTVSFATTSPCVGSDAAFTNNSTQGANSWTLGDGATSRLTNPNHRYASAGTYSVKLTVTTAAGCTNSMTNSVTVNPNPVASFTSNALCTGPNATFTNTSTIGGGSIANSQWNYGDGNIGTSNSHTYTKAGVYNVTLMVTSDKGCMTSSTSPVAVYEAPTAKFSANNVCLGGEAKFTNESSNASKVTWDFGDGATSNLTNPTHTYSTAGSFTVTLTANNPIGCSDVVTGNITVSANPTAAFTASDACEGAITNFTNNSSGSSSNSWNFGEGTLSTDESPAHMFTSSGNKTVTLVTTNNAGCSDEISKSVVVNTSPVATFTAIGNCEGDATMFSNTSQNGNAFGWSFGDGNTSTVPNPSNTYAATGDYRVLLIVSNANCVDSSEQFVSISPLPNSNFTHSTSGREVSFSPIELGGVVYSWNFDDGKSSTDISPVHRYVGAVTQTYNVCLELTDKAGCTSEMCNDVNVDLVGVNDVDAIGGFNVYPNPNQGAFVIALGEVKGAVSIALYDTKGVLVTVVDTSNPSTQFNIDVTGVAEGVYFVHVKNGDYTSTQRVVITK